MDAEGLKAFADTAKRFARQEVAPLLEGEGRDGNLELVPGVLERAEAVGLLASPSPLSPGHEYGAWGRASLVEGPRFSLEILEAIGCVCAGVAACLHVAGLGAAELHTWEGVPTKAAVGFFESQWQFREEELQTPPQSMTQVVQGPGGGGSLAGSKEFVFAPPGWETFVVYAAKEGVWQRVLVSHTDPGLVISDVGVRMGLGAMSNWHLSFHELPMDPAQLLKPEGPSPFLQRYLLGLCAIAVGNAQGALDTAKRYAAERYQGGGQIESHGAVQLLLGEAQSRLWGCAAHVRDAAQEDGDAGRSVRRACGAKLDITTTCSQVVTDCLQVLGGYGYMEDFRMEKRLRDGLTLKAMSPRPDHLRMICGAEERQ